MHIFSSNIFLIYFPCIFIPYNGHVKWEYCSIFRANRSGEDGVIAISGGNGALGLVMGLWLLRTAWDPMATGPGEDIEDTLRYQIRIFKRYIFSMGNMICSACSALLGCSLVCQPEAQKQGGKKFSIKFLSR